VLRELRVEQHPDKTFAGRIERGFTFLGYWITKEGVTEVAPSTYDAFQARLVRLYAQNARLEETRRGVELYVRRWKRWGSCGTFNWPEGFVVYAIVGRQIATPDPVPPVL
jgi:hypothetical protein